MRRFSLTFTLILAFALLVAISLWTAFQVSGRALQATVEAEEREELQTIGRVLEELVAEHSLRARLTARLTAGRDSLGATLANHAQGKSTRAPSALSAVVASARAASEIDLIEVSDCSGSGRLPEPGTGTTWRSVVELGRVRGAGRRQPDGQRP
jgi:hypothetical protein